MRNNLEKFIQTDIAKELLEKGQNEEDFEATVFEVTLTNLLTLQN
jgi:hypothetical protein